MSAMAVLEARLPNRTLPTSGHSASVGLVSPKSILKYMSTLGVTAPFQPFSHVFVYFLKSLI